MSSNLDATQLDFVRDELFSCVIGDCLDAIGYTRQFLPRQVRPLREEMRVVGRAKTVQEADCTGRRLHHEEKDHAFGVMFDALDSITPGEVYICTGASPNYACWGELMSTAAIQRGAVGAVIEGCSRDTLGIFRLNFPTFSIGPYGQDQGVRGRVIDYDCPIEFSNGVRVEPGDLVFGDLDGVVVIPSQIEDEVVEAALEKVRGENRVRKLIEKGILTRQVWDEHGIM